MKKILFIFLACSFLLVNNVLAQSFDLKGEGVVEKYSLGFKDITYTETPDGLLMDVNKGSAILFPLIDFNSDDNDKLVVDLTQSAMESISFIWKNKDSSKSILEAKQVVLIFFVDDIIINMKDQSGYNGEIDKFGFAFATKGKVLLRSIETSKVRFSDSISGFFSYHNFLASNVNLLYAPMWNDRTINIGYYTFFGLLLLVGLFLKKRIRVVFIIVVLSLSWLIMDLRMSRAIFFLLEKDYETYISSDEKTFRDRDDADEFFNFTKNLLNVNGYEGYVNFYPHANYPFYGLSRYYLYPNQVGLNSTEGKAWVIYRAPGFAYNEERGVLYKDNVLMAKDAKITVFKKNSLIVIE